MLTTLLAFGFVLGVLIFVHELGHFLTAKMVGIKVERFSLGFPPRMIGKQIGETDYCISWLPLGGYVKMAGMVDESLDTEITGEPWEFASKPVWQRMIVIVAGSLMNVLTAVVIFAGIVYFNGVPENPEGALVSEVMAGKPAESIGLQDGDVITSIEGQEVKTAEELTQIVHARPGEELTISWNRNGETLTSPVIPELDEENQIGLIGIRVGTKVDYREAGLFESIEQGFVQSYDLLSQILKALGVIITGEESLRNAVGGPIAIAKMAGESAKIGFQALLVFTAFISLNLGFFNMLPFPVLDGGHMVLLLIEAVRRKPLPVKTTIMIQKIGMAFLLALMIFIIINDITRWKSFTF